MTAVQDGSQPSAYPSVQFPEHALLAMLEVLEPSSGRAIHVGDDLLQAVAVIARGLLADGVLELLQALLARQFHALLKVIAQKVEAAFLRGIHDARLDGVQYQACTLHPLLDSCQC